MHIHTHICAAYTDMYVCALCDPLRWLPPVTTPQAERPDHNGMIPVTGQVTLQSGAIQNMKLAYFPVTGPVQLMC